MAKRYLKTMDLRCDEAVNMPTAPSYDCVLSNSVFSYFPNLEYTKKVLDKMVEKTNFSIALLDIHDIEKKEAFVEYRRKNIENYEERYKNLPYLFFDKAFFDDYSRERGLKCIFRNSEMQGYWNNDFVFHCYMYK